MASALDTLNAQLATDQAALATLESQLTAAQNDANIASLKQKIASVQQHYGAPNWTDKHGYHGWEDSSGNYWSGSDADSEWVSAWSQVNANASTITTLQNNIANYNTNIIPADQAAIQKATDAQAELNKSNPALQAQANSLTASAAAQVAAAKASLNKSNTKMYVTIAIVGTVLILVTFLTIYFIKRKKTNKNV